MGTQTSNLFTSYWWILKSMPLNISLWIFFFFFSFLFWFTIALMVRLTNVQSLMIFLPVLCQVSLDGFFSIIMEKNNLLKKILTKLTYSSILNIILLSLTCSYKWKESPAIICWCYCMNMGLWLIVLPTDHLTSSKQLISQNLTFVALVFLLHQ